MQSYTRLRVTMAFSALCLLVCFAARVDASCGDGVLEMNEECDPGGTLRIQGNPSNPVCTSGGSCFFEMTCCKFNCQYANPGPCFDGNDCTVTDECDNVGNCLGGVVAPEGQNCDDGLYCTVDTTCDDAGNCVGGTSPCTLTECITLCDEDTQSCLVNVGGACTDDGNACTDDVCDGGGDCIHPDNAAPCDDGMFCNGADTCSGGACNTHSGDPCQVGGQCSNVCDEGLDTCNLPNGTACDDGVFCNGADTCSGGSCATHAGDPCTGPDGDGDCSESCDEGADACSAADPNGTPCDDGQFCTVVDACEGGSCVGTGDPCTGADGDADCMESCDEALDDCMGPDPDDSPCDDGLLCTLIDACHSGMCVGEVPPECQDDNPCTYDSCDDGTGDCLNMAVPHPTCLEADLAQLVIGNRDDKEGKDKLKWKWGRSSEPSPLEDYGDPLTETEFDLCLYDTSMMDVPRIAAHLKIPSGEGWKLQGSKKWRFKNKVGEPDGVTVVKLRGGSRPALGVKANRENLDLVAFDADRFFDMNTKVIGQLIKDIDGTCWTSEFDSAKKNTAKKFRTRLRGIVVK